MNVILQGVVGSTVYGLDTENSDVDRMGIFVAPTEDLFSLNPAKVVDSTVVQKDPDFAVHEVGKFLNLALKGNPSVLELLYLPDYEYRTDWGRYIQINRPMFLSKKLKATYGGYVVQQMSRINRAHASDEELPVRIRKHGRHCYRLFLQGAHLLEHGQMKIRLDSDERESAFAVGDMAYEDVKSFNEYMTDALIEFDKAAEKSELPDEPDYVATEWMLGQIRRAYLPEDTEPWALNGLNMYLD